MFWYKANADYYSDGVKNPRCIGCTCFCYLANTHRTCPVTLYGCRLSKDWREWYLPNIFADPSGAVIPKRLRPRRWPEYFIFLCWNIRLQTCVIALWKKKGAKKHVPRPLHDLGLTLNRRIEEGTRDLVSGHDALVGRLPSWNDLRVWWMSPRDFTWSISSACKWSESPVWYNLS